MGLGPIEEDVRFNHGAASELKRLCNAAASVIENQVGSRAGWVSTAKADFKGYYSELFASNQENAKIDADEVATRLRDVARQADELSEAAHSEQRRREAAREWKQEQEDRAWYEKGWDWLTDGNDAPVPDMPEPPNLAVTPIAPKPRETPTPGTGGGGASMGTSSARPSDLRTFANGAKGANTSLSSRPATCRTTYDRFVSGCGWGSLDADSVLTGFDKLVTANEEDVRWVEAIADAFEEAGGTGNISTLPNSALTSALQARDIDATRQDIVIDPPIAIGAPPTSGYADDPVNTATGNFLEPETDLAFAGGSASLALSRMYNSFDAGSGAFGPGWSSWTEAGLELTDESARLRLPDGRVVVFPRLGEGWDRATGENMWLARTAEGLVASTNDGETWTCLPDGLLRAYSRGAGTTVTLRRDDEQRVVRLEHERGRAIDLAWDDALGRVVTATGSDGRTVTYAYDSDNGGRLVGATTALGTRTYTWNDAGLVETVVDADGVVEVENTYDEQRRVTAQRSPHGRTSRYVYLPGNVTVVSDPDGTRSNTWISDQRGRLIGVVDSDENRQSFAYDAHGNRVMVTERDGSVTVREYDDRGRMVREVTPSGADITYGYDDADRVTTVVTESGAVTEYSYDGENRNPSLLVDPEGGRTTFEWAGALLTAVVDPVGVRVEMAYDDHGDLVATTDALGNTARLERDAHGRVATAVTPSGNRTTFTYAPSGLLASRRDPDGAVWHFEHTTAGRLSATIDPTGARTVIEHDDAGEQARTIDPLGRAVTRTFDDLGNVAAVELPDGTTWRFTHDAMSRLTATTTPDGSEWAREYDATGDLTGTVDPTGARTGVAFDRATNTVTVDDGSASISTRLDPLGRAVGGEAADGSAAMATYDRCGRPVEQLDADGGLTRIERDASGKVVRVTTPAGLVTSYEYDACGRLAAVVDAAGARTTREYDADGRITAVTLPTGEVARTEYDECGRVVSSHQPGRGVARYRYDAAGRLAESSDTWNGRRKFRYDAAGQLVEVVNGNGGITRFEYDANGRAVAITDPLGQTTRREFDAMNHCVAETDPLGRTTRAGYDAAGRIAWQTDPDGHTTAWTYDAAGRVSDVAVDGRTVSTIDRDIRGRKATVTDHTRAGETSSVELEWNRKGQLVRRARDGAAVTWGYDADGRRTSLTTPDGTTTSYVYDAVGRLAAVEHPLLGRAAFVRDDSGRLIEAVAGEMVQAWEHRDGQVVAHSVTTGEGVTRTEVSRDEDGRITGLSSGEQHTTFGYDEACQLVEARTGGSVDRWRYDASGRLVAETVDGLTVEHTYDAAGQLITSTDSERTTRYSYDGSGRRVHEESSDGHVRRLEWTATGWLSSVTDDLPGGGTRRTDTHVDATGLLAEVDGTDVHWDAAAFAPTPVQAGDTGVLSAGPVTGVAGAWVTPGWRTQRSTGADPWAATGGTGDLPALPDGISIGADGGLSLAGMEWLGARVYDPASRGFLSVDPLDPVTGAGWSGNPYSYAGNDPLHALDPQGLSPLTDADLRAYNAANNTGFAAAYDWAKDNWEYLAGGAMVVAGVAAMFVPIPGAQIVGAGLISAGADTIIQKATTGEVNWGQVAISGAAGMLGGGVGQMAVRAGATVARSSVIAGVTEGSITSGATYLTGPGPHSVAGFVTTTAVGAGTSALPIPGVGDDLARGATRNLADLGPNPVRYGPMNPGPLSDEVANSFRSGSYTGHVLQEPTSLYRAYGGEAGPLGRYWSRDMPQGPLQAQLDSALNPAWGNTATDVTRIEVPAGTQVYEGVVGEQPIPGGSTYLGGGNQVFIPQVDEAWVR